MKDRDALDAHYRKLFGTTADDARAAAEREWQRYADSISICRCAQPLHDRTYLGQRLCALCGRLEQTA